MIVEHDNEWGVPLAQWNTIDDKIPDADRPDWEMEKQRIARLRWWESVAGQHGFPALFRVHHIHPVGLIANFGSDKRCIPLRRAQEIALRLSCGYEGRADLDYHALADDFDGQGTSFGLIQWNFGQNTLGPLLLKMRNSDQSAFSRAFPEGTNYSDLENSIINSNNEDQLRWARNLLATNRGGWTQAFKSIGDNIKFQQIQLEEALVYHRNVMICLQVMREISPNLMELVELTTYCALYDLCVQQGGITKGSTRFNIKQRVASDRPSSQRDFLIIVVQERAKTASSRWVADAMSRRMGIIQRSPYSVSFNGHSANRGNSNFHLLEQDGDISVCEL